MNRLFFALLLATVSSVACKKETKSEPHGSAPVASKSGDTTAPPNDEPAAAAAKNPEGCNSDLKESIVADYTFTKKCSPYTASGDLNIDGFTLTIEPGVEVRVADGASISIAYYKAARLVAKGTAEAPVKFVGARSDKGIWKALHLYAQARKSTLENVVIDGAGGSDASALTIESGEVTVKNVKFLNSGKRAFEVTADEPLTEISGLDLASAGADPDELAKLTFATLGVLGANTWPATGAISVSGNVDRDLKIAPQSLPFRVAGEVNVDPPDGKTAIVTIEAGVTFELGENSGWWFGYHRGPAGLKVKGTAEKPVIFTRYGEDAKTTPYKGFGFYGGGRGPEIDQAIFEFGGQRDDALFKFEGARGLGSITNSTFRHIRGTAIKVSQANERFTTFTGNTFDDVGQADMQLPLQLAHNVGTNTWGKTGSVEVMGNTQLDTLLGAGVPWRLLGEVAVDGEEGKPATLTFAPGATVNFGEGAHVSVGYHHSAKLVIGGAGPAVSFDPIESKWNGVTVYDRGSLSVENLTISGVGDDAAPLEVAGTGIEGSIKKVTFKGTKKGLRNCSTKVKSEGLKADKGVATEEKC